VITHTQAVPRLLRHLILAPRACVSQYVFVSFTQSPSLIKIRVPLLSVKRPTMSHAYLTADSDRIHSNSHLTRNQTLEHPQAMLALLAVARTHSLKYASVGVLVGEALCNAVPGARHVKRNILRQHGIICNASSQIQCC
jgi:hypothetical protein